jgi:hypothetical protein
VDRFICVLCKGSLSNELKNGESILNAKLLPCFNTICKSCLDNISNEENNDRTSPCKLCCQIHAPENLDEKLNFLNLKKILNPNISFQKKNITDNLKCENCPEKFAFKRCVDCKVI